MKLRNETQRRIRVWLVLVGIGILAGPLVNYMVFEQSVRSLAKGLWDGAVVVSLVGGYMLFVRDRWLRSHFQKMNFLVNVLINAFMYLVLFHLGRVLAVYLRNPDEITNGFLAFLFDPLILPVILVVFISAILLEFIFQMNRLIGHNVLWHFISGTYHHPKEEDRIFMFLDLQDSTTMAEQMGGKAYYALLEQFVNALTEPVLATDGEIHEYVGDEVVITWKMKTGLRNGNCLRCFFLIEDVLSDMSEDFERRFSRQPKFRAGLHGGQVIAGEMGDIKRSIVFVGDVVNTSARLEEYAKKEKRQFVVSDAIIDAIDIPDELVAVQIGDHQPRGKKDSVKLYEVKRAKK